MQTRKIQDRPKVITSGRRDDALVAGSLDAEQAAITIGRQLRAARRRRQLTQRRLADRIGISRPALSGIECGHGSRTPLEVWFLLASQLGLSFDGAFGRDPTDEPTDTGHLRMQELCLR
jgi:transcriptional regulator with XRE-family HTH domain